MAENSKIEWTDHTFNPWMGCTKVSPACQNCYAERDMDHRYGKAAWGPKGTRVKTSEANWKKPTRWNREAAERGVRFRVFCSSLADVFEDWQGPIKDHHGHQLWNGKHFGDGGKFITRTIRGEETPVTMSDLRRQLFALIDSTPNLDWLLLTKRPENVERMWPVISSGYKWSAKNVWLGTSIENQEWADKRLPYLRHAKARGLVSKTFVSAEPLVGPIILQGREVGKVYNHLGDGWLDWVITGGESGPNARPCEPDWFRSLRDQCAETGTPFNFKQWGEWIPYERSTAPMLESQHGDFIDGHTLPDGLTEHEPVKGWYWPVGLSETIYRRVGKKKAGRLLDGVEHNGVPASMETVK